MSPLPPPRLARRLVALFLPVKDRGTCLTDLDELYAHRYRTRGPIRARIWYWRQVSSFGWHLTRVRIRERRESRTGTSTRAMKKGSFLDTTVQDVKYAFRGFRKSPGFTAVAVATLALGIGANIAIFTVVHAVALRPLGLSMEDRLVRVWPEHYFTRKDVATFEERVRSFDGFTAYQAPSFTLDGDPPEVVQGLAVSWNHFDVFGREPVLGRRFRQEDSIPGAEPIVILSHGLWQRRFGSDPNVLGKLVSIGGFEAAHRRVVGVAASGFRPLATMPELWVPLVFDPDDQEYSHMAGLSVVGRLQANVTEDEARAELHAIASEMAPPLYYLDQVSGYSVIPLRDSIVQRVRPTMLVLLGAVGVVLLLCCSNVANLLLARAIGREQELGIRSAMGADWRRLLRQFLTENLLLGILGGFVGLLLVRVTSAGLVSLLPANIPRVDEIAVNGDILLFAFGLSITASFLFGLVPAWRAARATRARWGEAGQRLTAGRRRLLLNNTLVVVQVALSVVLVVGAGLLVKSFWKLQQVDTGFRTDYLLSLRVSPSDLSYPGEEQKRRYYRELLDVLRSVPGVQSAGAIHILPMTPYHMGVGYSPTGEPIEAGVAPPNAGYRVVTPGYMQTTGVPLLRGRDITERDRADSLPIGLINETMARKIAPGEDAVGKQVIYDDGSPWFTVVGVVGDIRQHRLDLATREEVYVPFEQDAWPSSMYVMVRAEGEPAALAPSLRDAIWSVDDSVPISQVRTMDEVVHVSMAGPRFRMLLFSVFAILAFIVSAVGVYGVMSYTVNQRTQEIGVRLALGATRSRILGDALGRALTPVAIGIVVGLAGAVAVSRLMAGFLFEVEPTDPSVMIAVAAFLAGTALAAGYLPARRAACVDPVVSLHTHG